MKKRVLSLTLAVIMLISMMPQIVFAQKSTVPFIAKIGEEILNVAQSSEECSYAGGLVDSYTITIPHNSDATTVSITGLSGDEVVKSPNCFGDESLTKLDDPWEAEILTDGYYCVLTKTYHIHFYKEPSPSEDSITNSEELNPTVQSPEALVFSPQSDTAVEAELAESKATEPVQKVRVEEVEQKKQYDITDEQLNQVKSPSEVSPERTYDTFYYTDGVNYTYNDKAVTFIDENKIKIEGETENRTLKNKKITINVNLDKENGTAKITFTGINIPIGVEWGGGMCSWNSDYNGYNLVYNTTINGVETVTSQNKDLTTIELKNLPKDGEFKLYGGKIFESTEMSNWYSGIDFGDGKGKVTSRTFSTLPDITITMSKPKKTYEITDEQLNQRKSLPNVTPQKTYDTFYYTDDTDYTYNGKALTFIDENTISVEGETENRTLKNKKVSYNVEIDQAKNEVVINFNEPLEVPVGQATEGRNKWDSQIGEVYLTYKSDIPAVLNVKSINKNTQTITIKGIPPVGNYTLSEGKIYEKSGCGIFPQIGIFEPKLFDNQRVSEGYFSTLPDITFAVYQSNQLGNVKFSIEKRTIGKGDTLSLTDVKLENGETVKDILSKVAKEKNIAVEYTQAEGKDILSSIDGDGAKGSSCWRYQVNDEFPNEGISDYKTLKDGDVIRIRYAVSAQSDELKAPLVKYLEKLVAEADSTLVGGNFTLSTKTALQDTIKNAKAIITNQDYNTADTAKELAVSTQINNLNVAVANLEESSDGEVSDEAQVPADFENDLWLQYDYLQMKTGDNAEIFPRRVPEASADTINNDIFRPNFNYEIIKGDSIKLSTNKSDTSTKVTAIKDGISIVKVTYDACEYKGLKFGASSPINTAYVVYDVNSNRSDVEIKTDIKQTSYDTIYFDKGDYTDFIFGVTANGANKIEATCNGKVLAVNGGKYTAQLENKSNIIGVMVTDSNGKRNSYYQVIDARKVEIKIANLTNPKKPVLIGDKVKVSFKGITHPVYKLAAIYNPTWRSIGQGWEDTNGTFVEYTNDKLGKVEGVCGQWDLATKNAITLTFTESGNYVFSNGIISTDWWGEPLGADKGIKNLPPNINANTHTGRFSQMPNFSIKVLNEISDNVPVTGITLDKTYIEVTEGDTFSLKATVTPENATTKEIIWSSDSKYFATVDQTGKITAYKASTDKVPEVTITATTKDGNFVASCKVTVTSKSDQSDSAMAEKVINQIKALYPVRLSSGSDISKVKREYNRLTESQKKLVTNLVDLYEAENIYLRLKLNNKSNYDNIDYDDRHAADSVINKIADLDTITLDSEEAVSNAIKSYNALTTKQKKLVTNITTLFQAENRLLKLKNTYNDSANPSNVVQNSTIQKGRTTSYGQEITIQVPESATEQTVQISKEISENIDLFFKESNEIAPLDQKLMIELAKEYTALPEEQKLLVPYTDKMEEFILNLANSNHLDDETGIKLDGANWFIRLNVESATDKPRSFKKIQSLQELLGEYELLSVWDINLKNVFDDKEYLPDKPVKISFPISYFGNDDHVCVVHYKDDGTIEFIDPSLTEDDASIEVNEFSYYALVSYKDGSSPFDLNSTLSVREKKADTNKPQNNQLLVIAVAVALVNSIITFATVILLMKHKKTSKKEKSVEN